MVKNMRNSAVVYPTCSDENCLRNKEINWSHNRKRKINQINKNDGILVYCNTGQRARKAAEKLKKLGFKNVFYIASTYKTILDI